MTDEVKTVVHVRFHGHAAEETFFVRTASTGAAIIAVMDHLSAYFPEFREVAMTSAFRVADVDPKVREVRLR